VLAPLGITGMLVGSFSFAVAVTSPLLGYWYVGPQGAVVPREAHFCDGGRTGAYDITTVCAYRLEP
jgi:hypothetical protein